MHGGRNWEGAREDLSKSELLLRIPIFGEPPRRGAKVGDRVIVIQEPDDRVYHTRSIVRDYDPTSDCSFEPFGCTAG